MAEEGEEWKEESGVNRLSGSDPESFLPEAWKTKNRLGILNEAGEVIPVRSLREWSEWLEESWEKNRRVGETYINGFRVSTVFLTINHDYTGHGPGLWFETMIFVEPENPPPGAIDGRLRALLDERTVRYATWAEAEKGHAAIVEMIRCGLF